MDEKRAYIVLYICLLTTPVLCEQEKQAEEKHSREKRFAVVALPIYAGTAVSPWVWAALVAAYGALVYRYSIRKSSSDSHSCANNRGWCRSKCFSHEYVDYFSTAICGYYKCCRPR